MSALMKENAGPSACGLAVLRDIVAPESRSGDTRTIPASRISGSGDTRRLRVVSVNANEMFGSDE